jgi:hypothetical protein
MKSFKKRRVAFGVFLALRPELHAHAGYVFGKPMDAAAMETLLLADRALVALSLYRRSSFRRAKVSAPQTIAL